MCRRTRKPACSTRRDYRIVCVTRKTIKYLPKTIFDFFHFILLLFCPSFKQCCFSCAFFPLFSRIFFHSVFYVVCKFLSKSRIKMHHTANEKRFSHKTEKCFQHFKMGATKEIEKYHLYSEFL